MRFSFLATTLVLSSALAHAQVPQDDKKIEDMGQNVGFELGIQFGDLLPNQIGGVTEITGLGGLFAAYRLGKDSFAEAGFLIGNGSGAKWKDLSVDIRMDRPLEMMISTAYVGPDMVYYTGEDGVNHLIFGAHLGGALQTRIGGSDTWFRADMRFGISPGTSLYIGFAFVYRFPSGNAGPGTP